MRRLTARMLRRWADRLDPIPRFQIIHENLTAATGGSSYEIKVVKP